MSLGVLEAVQEEEVSVVELRRSLWHLKQKLKKQSKILLSWKNKFIEESDVVAKLKAEKHAYLQSIQSQLLIFESNLKRSKSELESVIQHKDNTIRMQHNRICALSLALLKKQGADELNKIFPNLKHSRSTESGSCHNLRQGTNYNNSKNEEMSLTFSPKSDIENLNDSDSAIMMEDNYDSLIALPSGKGEIKIMRSVSDALEMISRGVTCSLNSRVSYPNQIKCSYGSLSSTSSEDSDNNNSPSSTMDKLRNELLRKEFTWKDTLSSNAVSAIASSTPLSQYSVIKISKSIKEDEIGMHNNFNNCNESDDFELLNSHQSFVDNSSSTLSALISPIDSTTSSTFSKNLKCYYSDSSGLGKNEIDSDATLSDGQSDDGDSGFGSRLPPLPSSESFSNKRTLFGSYEKLNNIHPSLLLPSFPTPSYIKHSPREELIQVTYNRVMSNHRSVTKPKDVKYKRINKAKSRSLEELRGKLKHFDAKQTTTLSVDIQVSDA